MTYLYYSTYVVSNYVVKFKKKGYIMSIELDKVVNDEVSVDVQKRAFMSKFGKYAAVSVGMATLMTPTASLAFNSGCKPRPCKPRKPRNCKVKKWSKHGKGSHGNGNWKPVTLKRYKSH